MMIYCMLSKKGYGSIKELFELDTDVLLDIIEYEQICQAIENYEYEKARG